MDKVEIELNIGKENAERLAKKTKQELIEIFVVSAIKEKVQAETIAGLERDLGIVERKLETSEKNIEQARGMIESVTERWYHYD